MCKVKQRWSRVVREERKLPEGVYRRVYIHVELLVH